MKSVPIPLFAMRRRTCVVSITTGGHSFVKTQIIKIAVIKMGLVQWLTSTGILAMSDLIISWRGGEREGATSFANLQKTKS